MAQLPSDSIGNDDAIANSADNENTRAADLLADSLMDWGVDVIFGIPGDGINGFIEALRRRQNKIKFILVRHEESAAFMACAYAKYTGKLGACLGTSGPGAIHLLNGLYDAKLDNIPVIAITGNTYSDLMNSYYQQDVNLLQLFSDVSVYNTIITAPEQVEMAVDIACRTAISKKGVSHITIPIDIQERKMKGNYSRHKIPGHTSDNIDFSYPCQIVPEKRLLEKAANILNQGNKIVILAGQGALNASEQLITVAERLGAPISKALLGKAVVADDHPCCIGGIGLLGTEASVDAMSQADTIFMVGTCFPYIDYLPKPGQARGVQVDIKAEKIGLRYPVEVGLVGDARLVLESLIPLLHKKTDFTFLESMQQNMGKWKESLKRQSERKDKPIKPQAVADAISQCLDDDAIVSVDSGTNTVWAARFIDIRKGMKFSLSGTLASMACGLPYAIAAQIAYPERQSIAFVGDGGFAMLMGEFATAVQYNLPVRVIILKNNTLGMIRWEQMAFLGNPEYGVEFSDINYAKIAEACGGRGYTIKEVEEVIPVLKDALNDKSKRPTIIEVYVDPFEPPMPPKEQEDFMQRMAESFAKGQPHSKRIGLTLFRNQLHSIRNTQ